MPSGRTSVVDVPVGVYVAGRSAIGSGADVDEGRIVVEVDPVGNQPEPLALGTNVAIRPREPITIPEDNRHQH